MISTFAVLRSFAFKERDVSPDSPIFRLHYSFTVLFFAAASLLTQGGTWFGGAIHCVFNKKLMTHEYVEALCWANGTYYDADDGASRMRYSHIEAVPFIRPGNGHAGENGAKFAAYYQWVALMFFFEAIMFYLPRWFWKEYEGGRMRRLIGGNANVLASFFCQNSKANDGYTATYFLSEVASFLNLMVQVVVLDVFLDGNFFNYGLDAATFAYYGYRGRSPTLAVFPRITKCSTRAYAMNGNLDKIDALCVLPLNALNEKIFLFLWYWLAVLSLLTTGLLAFRLVVCVSSRTRLELLKTRLENADGCLVKRVFKKLSMGDWFVLFTLIPHVDLSTMSELLHELDYRMGDFRDSTLSALSTDDVKSKALAVGVGGDQQQHPQVVRRAVLTSFKKKPDDGEAPTTATVQPGTRRMEEGGDQLTS